MSCQSTPAHMPHQCCLSVPIIATYQCPSVSDISAH
ncbi:unnamed protein product, partial [Staurois parvus]